MKNHPPVHQIELRIATIAELFNSMDPTPFHRRALDAEAEKYLESWALEFPQDSHFRIVVHIEQMPLENPTPLVTEAMHHYFEYKAVLARRKLRLLLLEGRASLVIGLGFLTICLVGADLLTGYATSTFLRLVKESLLIGGWVAMWRPLQIFLYDWWPIIRRRKIYGNLARAAVHVTAAA